MDYRYKKEQPQRISTFTYVTEIAPGETATSPAEVIYVKASDNTVHAVTIVLKQGKYTWDINQTPV